jgi:uncharacterized RDD family membrane protein YckC
VKCPKCSYLGFETGDRCKNCGYDFSLIAVAPGANTPAGDAAIRTDDAETGAPELWLDRMDRTMDEATRPSAQDHLAGVRQLPAAPSQQTAAEDSLPLFNPNDPDDIPLIALPSAPRPPLSVRRTPDAPRLRAVPRASRRAEPALNFREEPEEEPALAPPPVVQPRVRRPPAAAEGRRDVAGRRLVAAGIDHAILFAIDLAVVYFTLRMAGLDGADIGALPVAPLVTFLALVKVAYFTAFTAVGGQTIGKMALQIRVVGDEGAVDSGRAIRRTFAALLSLLPLGLGFLPAFFGDDRRALHDRLTHTRVVGLPSA